MSRSRKGGALVTLFLAGLMICLLILPVGKARAYDQYSINKDATNCAACHGDFRDSPYNEGLVRDPACPPTCDPNTEWADGLMSTHTNLMLDGQCSACHGSGPRFPVLLGSSQGVFGNLNRSCSGCHGRSGDGTGTGSEGFGAGLRQHHTRAGVTLCSDHHTDADPNNFTPVGEDILPTNYQTPGVAAGSVPDDPCNAGTVPEDVVGAMVGLDNDGDGLYDQNDTDCGAVAMTPGEALDLDVVAHDPGTLIVSLTYTPGCSATGNKIVFGPLQDVGTYSYTGETCSVGNSGSVDWTYPSTPDALFFVLVGDNGTDEASYGTDSLGAERPRQIGGLCALPQNLAQRCDP